MHIKKYISYVYVGISSKTQAEYCIILVRHVYSKESSTLLVSLIKITFKGQLQIVFEVSVFCGFCLGGYISKALTGFQGI